MAITKTNGHRIRASCIEDLSRGSHRSCAASETAKGIGQCHNLWVFLYPYGWFILGKINLFYIVPPKIYGQYIYIHNMITVYPKIIVQYTIIYIYIQNYVEAIVGKL